jgi:hypothetical protein
MPMVDNLKFELNKRLNDRIKYKLPMKSLKEDVEKLIEWLFKFLDEINKKE